MVRVELRHVSNRYILRDVNLTIGDGELLALLGPSGAGKTTLLNVIAGITDYVGSVLFDGVSVENKPASKRNVGYVFQDLALFPHLNVFSNIAYGLKMKKMSPIEVERKVNELLALMKIEHLRERYPSEISGGESQRVALARALSISPSILLLDEPLNNLDHSIRRYLRREIRRVQRRLNVTTLFVTHDVEEAEEVGDRVAVIVGGRIRQIGTFEEVFSNPADEEVADLLGSQNVWECSECRHIWGELYEVNCNGVKVIVVSEDGAPKRIAIPANGVYIYGEEPDGSHMNTFKGIVSEVLPPSSTTARVKVNVGENALIAELSEEIFNKSNLWVGREVFLKLKLKLIRAYG
jgi:ABC-type Fe3+/spermidine/putrescine transport system ATPase subunit